jgi:tetratricopeptide (TPR) repeat protein
LVAFLALLLVGLVSQTPVLGEPLVAPIPTQPSTTSQDREQIEAHLCPAVAEFRNGNFREAQSELGVLAREQRDQGQPLYEDAGLQLWRTLTAQARGETAAAIHGWRNAELEMPAEIWRQIGLAAAWLDRGELDQAAQALDNAWELDKENAMVRYYYALLHLERGHRSADWLDATAKPFRLAAWRRPEVVPNSAAMYRLAAIGDLERALENASELTTGAPLVTRDRTVVPELCPQVSDLMHAIGAKNFEAKSHVMLGQLFLEGDNMELAEKHFDEAAMLGNLTPYGYREVAQGYERELRYLSAARASGKAFYANPEPTSAKETMANVLRGFGQIMVH